MLAAVYITNRIVLGELNLGPRLDNGEARIGVAEGELGTVNDGYTGSIGDHHL